MIQIMLEIELSRTVLQKEIVESIGIKPTDFVTKLWAQQLAE